MKFAVPVLALFASFALSCSSSSSDNTGNPTDSGTKTDSGSPGDTGGDTATEDCVPDPDNPPPAGSVCVRHVTGSLVDEKGAPLSISVKGSAGLIVTVCGDICYFADPGATPGTFDVHVGKQIPLKSYNVIVHGLGGNASSYRPVPTPDASDNVALTEKVVAPVFDQIGNPLPADGAGGSASAGGLTLTVPAGASFELDPDIVELGDPGRLLKAFAWKDTTLPSFAAGSNVVKLIALGPFGSKTCKTPPCTAGDVIKMGVSLTNDVALPKGAAVEFLTLGFDLYSVPFTAGQMNVVATGHVSADGTTIDTDAGEGISTISWLGVRAKP